MIRLETRTYNMILTEKQQSYQRYYRILFSNQGQTIEQAKFANSPLVKAFEKQTKTNEGQGAKQTKAIESVDFYNKINDLKKVKDIFPDNQLTNLIKDRLNKLQKYKTLLK